MKKRYVLVPFILLTALYTAIACNVPVYRYALERWPSDPYALVVLHDADLGDDQKALIDELESANVRYVPALYVDKEDTRGEIKNEAVAQWREAHADTPLPIMLMFYPSTLRVQTPFIALPLDTASVELMKDSPVRREIARALLKNSTAVWLFIPGEDEKENEETKAMIRTTLDELEKTIKLNDSFLQEMEMYGQDATNLTIHFDLIEMDKHDPDERLLWTLLSELYEDVAQVQTPILIPIYGRARAMAIMLKEYIQKDYIEDACYFITGACSCEVKAGNPGFDLFIPVPWDDLIMGELVIDQALPPLTGVSSALEATAEEKEAGTPATEELAVEPNRSLTEVKSEAETDKTGLSPFKRNIIIIAVAAVGIILVGTLLLGRQRE